MRSRIARAYQKGAKDRGLGDGWVERNGSEAPHPKGRDQGHLPVNVRFSTDEDRKPETWILSILVPEERKRKNV